MIGRRLKIRNTLLGSIDDDHRFIFEALKDMVSIKIPRFITLLNSEFFNNFQTDSKPGDYLDPRPFYMEKNWSGNLETKFEFRKDKNNSFDLAKKQFEFFIKNADLDSLGIRIMKSKIKDDHGIIVFGLKSNRG